MKSAPIATLLFLLLSLFAQASQAEAMPVVIRSPAELVQYLKTTPANESPLSLLPPGARKRFLGTLVWGSKGLGGFATDDLTQYLTDAKIHRILALFDAESYADGLHGRAHPLTVTERNAAETPLERKFDEVYFARSDAVHGTSHLSTMTLYARLLATYQTQIALAKLDDSDVGLLFRAAQAVASDSQATRYLNAMQLDLAVLHNRGLATRAMITSVHDSLVAARRFDDANALATRYSAAAITPLPPLHDAPGTRAGSPTALVVEPDGKALLRKPIDMHTPLRIVVVAGCHFSVDAVRAIRADAKLDKLFREHTVWLAPQSESLADVLVWNRDYPDQPMHVAWRNNEWSMLDSWAIPTFYVFRRGKLVDQWSGWPADTGMQTLRKHLRRNDLVD